MPGICTVVFAAGLFSTTTFTLNVMLNLFLFAVALAVAAIEIGKIPFRQLL